MIPAPTQSAPVPISDEHQFREAIRRLSTADYLCLDTEFERNQTYFPRLCLLQIAAPGEVHLLDPLHGPDLAPLEPLLYEASVTKVFHSARQDLELLLRRFGSLPVPVFDTQIAAAALGYGEQLGYGELIRRVLGVELEKGHARTDWCARPLSAEQLRYAADDVRWLCPAYEALREALDRHGRLEWVVEDSARLAQPELYAPPTQEIWRRVRGLHGLDPARYPLLQALAAWREEQAMANDLPRRWVLPDEALVALAARGHADGLERLPGVSERRLRRWGKALRAVLRGARTGSAGSQRELTAPERLTPEQQAAVQTAMRELRALAGELGVSPSYLASRSQITRLLLGEAVPELTTGWRARVLAPLDHIGPCVRAARSP